MGCFLAYDIVYGLGYVSYGSFVHSPLDQVTPNLPAQPPLERNIGIEETMDSIRNNHKILKLFPGPPKTYSLLETMPHNRTHFTQGLFFEDGFLFESTGLQGKSVLAKIIPKTGKAVEITSLAEEYFGEGAARTRSRIVQLTYKHRKGFIYDAMRPGFVSLGSFPFSTRTGQGWGIAFDAKMNELVVSDGSSYLFFWDADTLQEKRYLQVKVITAVGWQPLEYLNELEVLPNGKILANVWYADVLVAIDPKSGEVLDVYNFQTLHKRSSRNEDSFNGIAYDPGTNSLYVTGKQWPKMYRVSIAM